MSVNIKHFKISHCLESTMFAVFMCIFLISHSHIRTRPTSHIDASPDKMECGMRVGEEIVAWREGEAIVFDDSYTHEVSLVLKLNVYIVVCFFCF